jgi:hypothetical protein
LTASIRAIAASVASIAVIVPSRMAFAVSVALNCQRGVVRVIYFPSIHAVNVFVKRVVSSNYRINIDLI